MVAASSLLSLFLIIEGLVMVMYVLNAGGSLFSFYPFDKMNRLRPAEGSLKYVITNAVAASFFLLGSILIVLFTQGEIYFHNIHSILSVGNTFGQMSLDHQLGLLLGFTLILLTFLFKVGLFPFHAWMADLYESSTLGVLTFFVLVPKMAILFTIVNLYRFFFINYPFIFGIIFVLVGLLSVVIGAVMASKQVKISRLIAYSSISQVGTLFILLPLVGLNSIIPLILVIIFISSYGLVMSYFMSVLSSFKLARTLKSVSLVRDLSFIKALPNFVQITFALFIFNLSGMPPFLGWLLKSLVLFTILLLAFDSFMLFDFSTLSQFDLSIMSFF